MGARRGRRATATATSVVRAAQPSASHPATRSGSIERSRAKKSALVAVMAMAQPMATTASAVRHEGQRRRPIAHTLTVSTSPMTSDAQIAPRSRSVAGTGGTESTRVRSHAPAVVRTRTPPAPRLATTGSSAARYLCADAGQGPLCADGSGPQALVKVERPERSEDV
jgi:hypothetical protein